MKKAVILLLVSLMLISPVGAAYYDDFVDIPKGFSGWEVCNSQGGICTGYEGYPEIVCKYYFVNYWSGYCNKDCYWVSDKECKKDIYGRCMDEWAKANCLCQDTSRFCDEFDEKVMRRDDRCKLYEVDNCIEKNRKCVHGGCGRCIEGFEMVGGNCLSICGPNYHREGENCVPDSPPLAGDCLDECSPYGAKQCSGSRGIKVCWSNHDSDSCLEWGHYTVCPSNQICDGGACITPEAECETSGTDCSNVCDGYWCSDGNVCNVGTTWKGGRCMGATPCGTACTWPFSLDCVGGLKNPSCNWGEVCCNVNYGGVSTKDCVSIRDL